MTPLTSAVRVWLRSQYERLCAWVAHIGDAFVMDDPYQPPPAEWLKQIDAAVAGAQQERAATACRRWVYTQSKDGELRGAVLATDEQMAGALLQALTDEGWYMYGDTIRKKGRAA